MSANAALAGLRDCVPTFITLPGTLLYTAGKRMEAGCKGISRADAHHLIESNQLGSPIVCTRFQSLARATDTHKVAIDAQMFSLVPGESYRIPTNYFRGNFTENNLNIPSLSLQGTDH